MNLSRGHSCEISGIKIAAAGIACVAERSGVFSQKGLRAALHMADRTGSFNRIGWILLHPLPPSPPPPMRNALLS